jgi:simple sugar transport system ATP-binding protein
VTGLYHRDEGVVLLDNRPLELQNPSQAPRHGISTVYQEVNLIPTLSVAENIFIGRQPRRKNGSIDWATLKEKARVALEALNVDVDVERQLSSCSVATQQMVAIARALDISAKVLIFDEPTSCLDSSETQQLFDTMDKLRKQGVAILFITHFIDQVYAVSDRITILRNGKLVGVYETKELPKFELVAKMLGRELTEFTYQEREDATQGKREAHPFVRAQGIERQGYMSAFDLELYKGEVLGLAGLLGSGRTETAKLLYGVVPPKRGEVYVNGKRVPVASPRKATELGFGFCPEDRKAEGFISGLTLRENIILAIQARRGVFRRIPYKKQMEIVDRYIKAMRIVATSSEQPIDTLSGGNQQKVIVARWLASEPEMLILDEPTRGIDVGAKADIQRLIIDLSRRGMAVLFISSLLDEVVRCSDRVTVLRDRAVVGELTSGEITEHKIMETIAAEAAATEGPA